MSWPLSQDYNEAVQSPKGNFADADLRRGEAVCNALGLPMPHSGNFADVYQVRCPDGKSWAVKCFTREAPGLRERYAAISEHLRQAKLPFTVDFTYLEKGIRVAGAWYPALKMQWVEGLTLNQFVAQYLDKPAMLEALLQIWAKMAQYLRAAEIGHCDLQHGNVLLVPGATPNSLALKLIDYDGMWIPALAGRKSGEVGHPNYQHPQRLKDGTYSLDVDRFPLLLVATALRALKARKTLWGKYDNGDNMLFKEADLSQPAASAVFQELAALPDPGLAVLAAHVRAALAAGLKSAPLLEEAMPEVRPAPAPARTPRPLTSIKTQKTAGLTTNVSAPNDALDFDSAAGGIVSPSMRRKAPTKARRGGIPVAAWIGGGAALAVASAAAVALAAWALTAGPGRPVPTPPVNPVAQGDLARPPKDEPPSRPDGAGGSDKPPAGASEEPAEAKWEGVRLIPVASTPGMMFVRQDMKGFNGQWSGDAQLWCKANKAGDFLELSVPVPETGRYMVTVALTKARDYGVVQLSLNQKPLGPPIDCYHAPDVVNSGPMELATLHLKAGDAVLRLEAVGTNPKSQGMRYLFGLDYVDLKPAGPDTGPAPPANPAGQPAFREPFVFGVRHTGPVLSVSFSRDGRYAASLGADKLLRRFNLLDGSWLTDPVDLRSIGPRAAALLPDGKRAVVAGGDKFLHLVNLEGEAKGQKLAGHKAAVTWVDVSPVADEAVSCDEDGFIYYWDLQNAKLRGSFRASAHGLDSVHFAPDGRRAVAWGQGGKVEFWDVPAGSRLASVDQVVIGRPAKAISGGFLPGDRAFLGIVGGWEEWDLKANHQTVGGASGELPSWAVAASADGGLSAYAGAGATQFWAINNKTRRASAVPCPNIARDCLAIAPDGRHILAGGADGTVHYWEYSEGAAAAPAPLAFGSGWDKPVDPDGDCSVTSDNTGLVIEAPGNKEHSLAVERAVMNAPRVLRDLEGDFTVQVRVGGDLHPVGPSTSNAAPPFVAGGLVVIGDDRNYIRLERAAFLQAKLEPFVNWELRVNGQYRPVAGGKAPVPDVPTYLQLRRTGDRFSASYSENGVKWTDLLPQELRMAGTVKVGLAAHTTSSGVFKARFEDFRLTASGAKPPPVVKAGKAAPPEAAELAKAIEAVKEVHKDEYAKEAPKDRADLSAALLAEADAAKGDPARRYALLTQASDLAARGDDPAGAVRIADQTADAFDVPPRGAKVEALRAVGKTFDNRRAVAKPFLDAAAPLLREARAADDYETVAPLLDAVRNAAGATPDTAAGKAGFDLVKEMSDLQAAFDALRPARQTLKDKPDDAAANLAVGKYYVVRKQEWDKGLPLLAKCGEAALADAAGKDAASPQTADDRLAAADAWWKAAEADVGLRKLLQGRALLWYDKVLPDLDEKDVERVKTRVIELCKTFPDFATAWGDLDVTKCEVVGNYCLRLKAGQAVTTKQAVSGVLTVEAVVRCTKPRQRFEFVQLQGAAKELLCDWAVADNNLTVSWLWKKPSTGRGQADDRNLLKADQWTKYSCTLRSNLTQFTADGKGVTGASMSNDTTRASTFQVRAEDETIEVQSFTAKAAK